MTIPTDQMPPAIAGPGAPAPTTAWVWAALAASLLALGGSLFLSLGMGLKACPLCFYQRTFAMSLVGVLGLGLYAGVGKGSRLGLLAMPLATAGLGVAVFHVYLEIAGRLECPAGVMGLGTAPQQSLAIFLVIGALLAVDVLRGPGLGSLLLAVLVGGLFAVASCTSNPPMPAPRPYDGPPDVCRPPYRKG